MKHGYQLMVIAVLSVVANSCQKWSDHDNHRVKFNVIYLETNDYHEGRNAILAYRVSSDGVLSTVSGSPFFTRGTGIANPNQVLGPNDSDGQLQVSEDGKFLLAVNSGSNSIAVFRIQTDGSLTPVAGSPFPSGGQTPVSIGMNGNNVFVVNKSDDPMSPPTFKPNYATFTLDNGGRLSATPSSFFETTAGCSPALALVSRDGKYIFGADFLGFSLTPAQGTLRSFSVDGSGKLSPVDGTPYTLTGAGGALGLCQHPSGDILYVGFPMQAKVGVYGINESSGALTYQTSFPAGAFACWMRTTKSGHYLYVLNSTENTVSQFDASNAQLPSRIGKITLRWSGPGFMAMGKSISTSEAFALALSPDEKFLFVLSQHANPDFSMPNYNVFHVLAVGANGTLSEPNLPLQLPVDATMRPQGLVTTTIGANVGHIGK